MQDLKNKATKPRYIILMCKAFDNFYLIKRITLFRVLGVLGKLSSLVPQCLDIKN